MAMVNTIIAQAKSTKECGTIIKKIIDHFTYISIFIPRQNLVTICLAEIANF